MSDSLTPTLDEIAAHGNRGHQWVDNNIITCKDGTKLSVVAGGGAYCLPRPGACWTVDGVHYAMPFGGATKVPCDYPGPYTHVEVRSNDPELLGFRTGGRLDVASISVLKVRDYIIKHGGEAQ